MANSGGAMHSPLGELRAVSKDCMLAFHLDVGAGEWPHDLVGPLSLSRMLRAARGFPHEVAGLFAECHLSSPDRTDLVARVLASQRWQLQSGGSCPSGFQEFVNAWCLATHPAFQLPAVDIECDEDSGQPFLCPYFEPDLVRGHRAIEASRRRRAAAGEERLALTNGPGVLRALDPGIPESWFERLTECVHALPEYGVLIPGWSQRKRPGAGARAALRVIIALPRHALPSYLERLHWVGDVREALSWMNMLRPSSPWIGFDADICAAGLGPRLGFYQEHPCVSSVDPELAATLDRLEVAGLCQPRRLRGLRQWVEQRPAQPAPGEGRSLSLKLVTVASGSTSATAKAYVSTFDVPVVMRRDELLVAPGAE
jgi:hypothetical protein